MVFDLPFYQIKFLKKKAAYNKLRNFIKNKTLESLVSFWFVRPESSHCFCISANKNKIQYTSIYLYCKSLGSIEFCRFSRFFGWFLTQNGQTKPR